MPKVRDPGETALIARKVTRVLYTALTASQDGLSASLGYPASRGSGGPAPWPRIVPP